MNNYRIETYRFPELKDMMKLPTYQRPLVWSNDQKVGFIDNISKGFPFGSLLLYRYESGEAFTLIDGQQRYTTLQEYMRNPERYFPLEDSQFINELIEVSGAIEQSENARAELGANFVSIAKELIQQKASGMEPASSFLVERVIDAFPLAGQDNERMFKINNIQGKLIRAWEQYIDLETLQIPCVVFTGERSDLPEVFANVNLGGRKLTKYQVFAAQWDRYSINLQDGGYSTSILDKAIDRYERLTQDRGGLVIEDFSPEEMRRNRKVTLPELCHALGEMVVRECCACWPEKAVESDDTVDTIGYNTLAIAFGIQPKEIGKLPERVAAAGFENDPPAIERLLKCIMSEYAEINGRFAKYLKHPGTKLEYETAKTSGHLQFLSFFAALWKQRYGSIESTSLEVFPGYKYKGYEESCKNLFPSFVHDMLTGQWKGSGDTRLGNYITGTLNYLNPVGKEKLQIAMSSYLEELNEAEGINVDQIAKTLLTIFANSHRDEYAESSYDFEHLIPRDTLNKRQNGKPAYKAFGLAGGGLGNIAYLDTRTNRGKGAKTLIDASGEMFSFDGRREVVDAERLRAANFELLNGNPNLAKSFMKDRAEEIGCRVVEYIIAS